MTIKHYSSGHITIEQQRQQLRDYIAEHQEQADAWMAEAHRMYTIGCPDIGQRYYAHADAKDRLASECRAQLRELGEIC